MKSTSLPLILFVVFGLGCSADPPDVQWTFRTGGRVLSHAAVSGATVYFGSSDGEFHAVGTESGERLWSHRSRFPVRGTPLVAGDTVYFSSGNDVYALDAQTGSEIWSHLSDDETGAGQIDPWDYHTGSLAMEGSTIYAGLGNGYVCGLDAASGEVTTRIATIAAAPVRSGLLIDDAMLYFGDWEGRVYAYDLQREETAWTTRTFAERPYQTFGSLTAGFAVDGDLLFFGARNTELQALDKNTGEVAWSYIEETGGWISGDPVIEDGILYIAGSDNHELYAFDAASGAKLWTFEFTFNNFSRPLIRDETLFLTTGDAYSVYGDGIGRGFLYVLDKGDGALRSVRMMRGNSFSSPVIGDGLLFVGSEDSTLYAFNLARLVEEPFAPAAIGYDAVRINRIEPQPLVSEAVISYSVAYPAPITIEITTLADSTVCRLESGERPAGEHTAIWNGHDDDGHPVADGYYFVKAGSQDFYRTAFIQKTTAE